MNCFKITQDNKRCSRKTKHGYCWQHKPKVYITEEQLQEKIHTIEIVNRVNKYFLEVIKPFN